MIANEETNKKKTKINTSNDELDKNEDKKSISTSSLTSSSHNTPDKSISSQVT
jgi:hypothetical protein